MLTFWMTNTIVTAAAAAIPKKTMGRGLMQATG
jgi:hypothetical protein